MLDLLGNADREKRAKGDAYSPQRLTRCELLCDVEGGGGGGGTLDTRRVAEATLQVLKEKRICRGN